jgi:DNA-binding CsgD family transcriptional regulator
VLVGRESELERLEHLCARARKGSGGALLLEGEAGIGKSALLAEAAARADGFEVLSTAGVEAESELPFAGLAMLLEPLYGLIGQLPAAQADALRVALSLEAGAGADPVATLHGVVSLAAAASTRQPLLVLVDDLPWLDPPTADAIAFLARRAASLPLALLLARRTNGEAAPAGAELVRLGALDREASLRLLAGAGLAPHVAEHVAAAAAGNPLALKEIPGELSAEERVGRAAIGAPLPAGPTLERVFGTRLGQLPPAARRAVLLAAAASRGDALTLRRALGDDGDGIAALAPAEELGLVRIEGGAVAFTHPLVRSAAYHRAASAERREAHRALAAAAETASAGAWHRALAADGPDEEAAQALSGVAGEAAARGAPASAADALERAAALSADEGARFGRTLGAAYAAMVAGQLDRATRLIDDVLPSARDPLARADAQRLRAGAILLGGHPMEGYEILLAEAERIAELDDARTAALLTDAGVAQMASGHMDGLASIAERAAAAARKAGDERPLLPAVMLAEALAVQGDHARARETLAGLEDTASDLTDQPEVLAVAGLTLMWLEDHDRAGAWLDRMISEARAAGKLSALPMPLAVRACVDMRSGNLQRSGARAEEAIEIAEVAAGGFGLSFALSTLATVEGWRGDEARCRAHAERARELEARFEMRGTYAFTELALATLELGLGRSEAAAAHSLRCLDAKRDYGVRDPTFLQDGSNLIEACVREGRTAEAEAALANLADAAELTGGAWARAAVERCRGLLAEDDAVDRHFAEALRAHDSGTPMPLERARTLLCQGERLRRARRRADARAPLEEAERTFERAGARSWAERARQELAATGAPGRRKARRSAGSLDLAALTPQEREVCRLVAAGSSNREVAAALFISPRTVEYHLGNAYRKLGLRSRTELTAALVSAPGE